MAIIRIEIKDGYEIAVAKELNFQYPEDRVPPLEEHIAAIESYFKTIVEDAYEKIIKSDPEVLQLKDQLQQKLAEKRSEIKGDSIVESEVKGK